MLVLYFFEVLFSVVWSKLIVLIRCGCCRVCVIYLWMRFIVVSGVCMRMRWSGWYRVGVVKVGMCRRRFVIRLILFGILLMLLMVEFLFVEVLRVWVRVLRRYWLMWLWRRVIWIGMRFEIFGNLRRRLDSILLRCGNVIDWWWLELWRSDIVDEGV